MFCISHHPWQHVAEAQTMTHPYVPICTHPLEVSETIENNIQLLTFWTLHIQKSITVSIYHCHIGNKLASNPKSFIISCMAVFPTPSYNMVSLTIAYALL
jgi:hypothetical protein